MISQERRDVGTIRVLVVEIFIPNSQLTFSEVSLMRCCHDFPCSHDVGFLPFLFPIMSSNLYNYKVAINYIL
jgi:hypothetical protein